tara:strand:- start:1164 stop:1343 length:180 start_codon:yes stop_codon:yes gene_type:complete
MGTLKMKYISKVNKIIVSDNNGEEYYVVNQQIINQVKKILNTKNKVDVIAIKETDKEGK